MKLLKIAALAAAVLSGGCATEMAWQRIDGRPIDRSFDWAVTECRRYATQYDEEVEAMHRCMHRRGYVWAAAPNGYY